MDERGELGGFDLGPNADLLQGYPKGAGMEMALRSLSPEVIVCDELGQHDLEAVQRVVALVWHWWPRSTGKLKRFTAVRCAALSWKQEPFKPRSALWDAKRLEKSPQSSPWQGSTKGVGNAVKLIGAGLVLFSGLLAGILAAARLQRRARLLLDWMTLLQNFQTGIRYSAGSLRS